MATTVIPLPYANGACGRVSIGPNNQSRTYTIPNNFRGMLVLSGISSDVRGMWIMAASGGGSISYDTVVAAADIVIITAANSLTLKNTGGNAAMGAMIVFNPLDLVIGD